MIPPIILAMYVFCLPESPRWRIAKAQKTRDTKTRSKQYRTAFQDLMRLRNSELLAARDMILIHYRLEREEELRKLADIPWYRRGVYELFSKRRNRRAMTASLIVMFFQQFCGINVLIYYSSYILLDAKYSADKALLVSQHSPQGLEQRTERALTNVLVVYGRGHDQFFHGDSCLFHYRQVWAKETITRDVPFPGSVSALQCDCF